MQNLPHHYAVTAQAQAEGSVQLTSPGLDRIESAAPAEFGGPGDLWSPETLLVAAVVDCFILTFKAIARASKLDWLSLQCDADGVLDRPEKVTRFTEFRLRAVLEVAEGTNEDKAMRLLDKAEHSCLITNSLNSETHLVAEVKVAG
jgi:peroxiredoxin-like protein